MHLKHTSSLAPALETEPPSTESTRAFGREPKPFSHPELNSLRLFAFALVFLNHAQPVGGIGRFSKVGRFGVPVFFLLSAYLICTLLLREREATGTVRVGYFMVRRVLRIWPLYFVALFGGALLGHLLPDVRMPRHMLLYFLLLVGNVFVSRHGWTNSPTSILWSLSIEEQFYLVVPFVASLLGRRGLKLVCWAALALSQLVLLRFGLRSERNDDTVWLNSFVCFQFFALGGLIAAYKLRGLAGRQLPLRAGLFLGGLGCFLVASADSHLRGLGLQPVYSVMYGFVAVGTVAVFFAFFNFPAKRRSLPGYLGLISYGLYVFHAWCLELTVDFLETHRQLLTHGRALAEDLIALGATVLLAALSYRFFELPILRLKRRFEIVHAYPA